VPVLLRDAKDVKHPSVEKLWILGVQLYSNNILHDADSFQQLCVLAINKVRGIEVKFYPHTPQTQTQHTQRAHCYADVITRANAALHSG
jgi:hypothetical protein